MRRPFLFIVFSCFLAVALPVQAASGRVIKVLPHLLDLNGKHALSPSLFDRDAYQAYLRQHTNQISGIRFDVQWKARGESYGPLLLRMELRGTANGNLPSRSVLETPLKPTGLFNRWTSLPITGEDFRKFGEVTAWRATLWEGDTLLDEQKSFLW
ncbi:MAG TPA: hypothetical protein VK327_05870 [Candidatus Paceibacterota bacterium]|nr:hypothetical protein [Candidatus Paceibacterota bacterium]